jgi:protein ImuB
MRRVVSVYLPTWPTDRVRKHQRNAPPRDRPLVTVRCEGSSRIVASVCRAARQAGLRPGMTAAQAHMLVPELAVAEATPEEDAAALARLALWCSWCSPLVAPDLADGIWIDIAGSAHLFGGEGALLRTLLSRLRGGGCAARAAVADTPGAAWAVARFAPRGAPPIVAPGQMAAAIASLPVRALRLSDEAVAGLSELGLERVAQLAALPRAQFTVRFGAEVLRRFDQALGREPELLAWTQAPDVIASRLTFAEPISAYDTLERVARDLTGALCRALERRCLGARRLDLVFRRVDGQAQAVCIGTARATRDARHLGQLLCARLAQVDPGFGVDEASLTAALTEPLAPEQGDGLEADSPGRAGEGPDLDALVDRLGVRVGPKRLFRVVPVESRIPERSVRRAPPLAPKTGLTWPAHLDRPTKLINPPEPITATALLPDAPPAFFVWRGQRHRVVQADGPERVRGEWWISDDELSSVRDYYRIETEQGGRYWIFRDAPMHESPRWWLQGVFA